MGKIANYITDATPQGSDKVIGTDVTDNNETKNYTLQSIANLAPIQPAEDLQATLNAGNTATQNINLTGTITLTAPGGPAYILEVLSNAKVHGDFEVVGNYLTSAADAGTNGQVLISHDPGFGNSWVSIGDGSTIPLTATKMWFGNAANAAAESTNILNDESGAGLLSLNQIAGSTCVIDNFLRARVTHPVGPNNLSYGSLALNAATNLAGSNTGIGIGALTTLTDGLRNTAVGSAGAAIVSGSDNTAVGAGTMASTVTDRNTAVGTQALQNGIDEDSVAIGYQALLVSTFGRGNTAVGTRAGNTILGGGNNCIFGRDAGTGITGESNVIAIGQTSAVGTVGDDSIAIGTGALVNPGVDNIAIGRTAMNSAPLNFHDAIAIGRDSMAGGGNEAIAIGNDAMPQVSGSGNIAIGSNAMDVAGLGANSNICIGQDAMSGPVGTTAGDENISIGFRPAQLAPGGWNRSVAIGSAARISRSNEFSISTHITEFSIGTALAAQVASGAKVYADNTAALAGSLLPGDLYSVGPTGIAPAAGVAAPIAIVY